MDVVPDTDSVDVVVAVVRVVAEPTRIVGTRVDTFDVFVTPTRLLIYRGEFTVSVWTIDARDVFAPELFDDARVVSPGCAVLVVFVVPVERTVVVGRFATVVVALARDVPTVVARVVALRPDVVCVAVVAFVGRVEIVRAVDALVTLRDATLRPVVVVVDVIARDVAARPFALRGLTAVGTTGVTAVSVSGSAVSIIVSDSSITNSASGISSAYCAINSS